MKNFIGLIVLIVAVCSKLQAQHSEGNPFLRLGYKADVYTFGEKKEFGKHGWKFRVKGWKLRAKGWKLRAKGWKLRAKGWKLR